MRFPLISIFLSLIGGLMLAFALWASFADHAICFSNLAMGEGLPQGLSDLSVHDQISAILPENILRFLKVSGLFAAPFLIFVLFETSPDRRTRLVGYGVLVAAILVSVLPLASDPSIFHDCDRKGLDWAEVIFLIFPGMVSLTLAGLAGLFLMISKRV
jgi:hypothetical protein